MPEYNAILVSNCINKSKEALSDAKYLLDGGRKSLALNRNYYAVFYIVQALAYKENFVTSKHSQLMGWFNKKFIHEQNVFPKRMYEIYKNSFFNRQEADYELLTASDFSIEQLNTLFGDCEYFVDTVTKYLSL